MIRLIDTNHASKYLALEGRDVCDYTLGKNICILSSSYSMYWKVSSSTIVSVEVKNSIYHDSAD